MKKRLLSAFLALVMVCSMLPLSAIPSFALESSDYEYEVLSEEDKTCEIMGYSGTEKDLVIPSDLDGYTVTRIGYCAFEDCTFLTSITVPDSVMQISDISFADCTNLAVLNLPKSITSIGAGAFRNTSYYNNAENWENGVLYGVLYIDKYLIYGNGYEIGRDYNIKEGTTLIADDAFSNVDSVTIPNSVKYIGDSAFSTFYLQSVSIGTGVVYIGAGAFSGTCLKSVSLPDSVEYIGENAFRGCGGLENIYIGNGVTAIGRYAFEGTKYYENESHWDNGALYIDNYLIGTKPEISGGYTVKEDTRVIADSAFAVRDYITHIEIPNSVIYIGKQSFYECNLLTNVLIGDGVISIGDEAFDCCYKLGSVTIGKGVESIGMGAFRNCALTSIMIPDSTLNIGADAFAHNTKLEVLTIGNGITKIRENTFLWCRNLTSVTLGSGIRRVANGAFTDCPSIENVYYTGDVVGWLNIVFEGRDSHPQSSNLYIQNELLTDLVIPDEVTYIGNYAFFCCNSLKNVTIGANVIDIGIDAFSNCKNLSTVTIGEKVKRIEEGCFNTCLSLDNVFYNGTIIDWMDISFSDVGANPLHSEADFYIQNELLTDLTIPDGITVIDDRFNRCTSLQTVTFPESVTTIGDGAFFQCTALTEVVLSKNLISIDKMAFYDCSLTEITIPDSVTSIGESAFAYNYKLFCIDIPAGVECIEKRTFESCGLQHIVLPDSITSIADDAFASCYTLSHVFFAGNEEEWNTIGFGINNEKLTEATIHCNCLEDMYEIRVIEPICTTDGYTEYVCSVCGEEFITDWQWAPGYHTKGTVVETVAPTCTSDGYTKYICSVCNEEYKTDWVERIEHSYMQTDTVAPNCTERGYTINCCADCGTIQESDYVDAIGHTFTSDICVTCGMYKDDCLESSHPYADNANESWTLTKPGAQSIAITFSRDTYVESGWDYIGIYDANGTLVGLYTDNQLAGKTIVIVGDTATINLTSDYSRTNFGFALSKVEADVPQWIEQNGIVITESQIGNILSGTMLQVINTETTEDRIIYDISLVKDGVAIQPNGTVTVKIPVPDTMNGANCKVYREETDGTLTDMQAVFADGYMVFTTDHFSKYVLEEKHLGDFKVKTVSLSLASSITMNFKVLKSALEGFENPYLTVTKNGNTVVLDTYTEQGDYYVFAYENIAPQTINDTVTAVVHATRGGKEYTGTEFNFSVAQYAYGLLNAYGGEEYASLCTLLVDLLNYGTAAQSYQNYKTDALVNAKLTDEQRAWGTSENPTLNSALDLTYATVENPTVTWKSAGLQLNNSVAVRYKFAAENAENITLHVTCGNREFTYSYADFTDNGDGTYSLLFDELYAHEMREDIFITAMEGNTAVSNTMRYSVETYALQVQNAMPDTALNNLTQAMMAYGISAENYAG